MAEESNVLSKPAPQEGIAFTLLLWKHSLICTGLWLAKDQCSAFRHHWPCKSSNHVLVASSLTFGIGYHAAFGWGLGDICKRVYIYISTMWGAAMYFEHQLWAIYEVGFNSHINHLHGHFPATRSWILDATSIHVKYPHQYPHQYALF